MRTITVTELRRNATEVFRAVESGESFVVTRRNRPIARLLPNQSSSSSLVIRPARKRGRADLAARPRHQPKTAPTIEALIQDMKSTW
ncbi:MULTISPECIES: type II toxin-antitoxin system Phd/YefM family antitoxin [unclassified Gordonia (in: high G+C Gram-positive bacteria)]|uniref:type II toxin-antitoxin system Phd/YefM family antitoxin n=1 Tax=unclassified Gordonia (in: high G+C Gram-positive bacteria) TaxID=2657482 RepID=UPI0025C151D6|nr:MULTISPECIES: type II toxin-antitoxin system Phd/YefM family antitoxin [unclassified Gordonia (in: high G+C Gram-positive bacteria)]